MSDTLLILLGGLAMLLAPIMIGLAILVQTLMMPLTWYLLGAWFLFCLVVYMKQRR